MGPNPSHKCPSTSIEGSHGVFCSFAFKGESPKNSKNVNVWMTQSDNGK